MSGGDRGDGGDVQGDQLQLVTMYCVFCGNDAEYRIQLPP